MAIKKSELYSSLWQSCDELRGGMDASQYKDYVLVLLFVKYVSDKAASPRGYVLEVPEDGTFAAMVALKGDKEIGEGMNKIIARLAEANDLQGVITVADWNDPNKLGQGKEMVDRLSALVGIFESLDFSQNLAAGDDLLGDAYEYLMRHFATESGKSKGQFYTPAEVSRVMARVIELDAASGSTQSIHDPACGSGSLLLKAHDEAQHATGLDLALYGQEMDNATQALARMNMILHDCPTAEIVQGNTIASPSYLQSHGLKRFDYIVANPPFSTKSWRNGFDPDNDLYGRFEYGMPPKRNGDYAFLLHVITCLKSTGKGAVILPHGVLFRGNKEADIRREIVRRGFIKGIIGLPANLFYGTGIPACIIVIDKEGAAERDSLFMVDASKGFIKDGNKNRLRAQDIHRIVDVFNHQTEVEGFARMVPIGEIADEKNDFNLNLPRYIDTSEPEDIQDIEAHLRGGIPTRDVDDFARFWEVFPDVRVELFEPLGAERPGYSRLKVEPDAIKSTIFEHAEFKAWSAKVSGLFEDWKRRNEPRLMDISATLKPKSLIHTLSEDLLAAFEEPLLIDAYDIYQHLMDFWAETMQDDVYLVVSDGWVDAAQPRLMKSGKKNKEKEDFKVGRKKYKAELIPPELVIARYFPDEQAAIDDLEAEAAELGQAANAFEEEHRGEDGLLDETANDKGNITKANLKKRIRALKKDADADPEELAAHQEYYELTEGERAAKRKTKKARKALLKQVFAQYGELDTATVKRLTVADKWFKAIQDALDDEVERVSQQLSGRLEQLAERYADPLPELADEVDALSARVSKHLERMGMV